MFRRSDYKTAIAMRSIGKTYGEIRNVLSIPKSTLSTWFSDLEVSSKAQKILDSKRKNGYLKLVEFNKVRTKSIRKEHETIRKEQELRIGNLSDRELMIIGASLYWGEGQKFFREKRGTYPYINFSNSDPDMVKVFIKFSEKILNFKRLKLMPKITLYPNLSPNKAINFWRKITKIPKENFKYYIALSRASKGKRPKNILPFGTIQLRIHGTKGRQEFFKIKGLIDGIIKSSIKS